MHSAFPRLRLPAVPRNAVVSESLDHSGPEDSLLRAASKPHVLLTTLS